MRTPFILVLALVGCGHKPPVTHGNANQRQPINSQETAARLEFCASLGQAVSAPEPEEEEAPLAPVSLPTPAPVKVAPIAPVTPRSYLMRVYFPKNKVEFKPAPEQLEELKAHLKTAESIHVRVRSDAMQLPPSDEKKVWEQAIAAKNFLLEQGATPQSIRLHIFPVTPNAENSTPEGQAELRRVEIEVFGGAQ